MNRILGAAMAMVVCLILLGVSQAGERHAPRRAHGFSAGKLPRSWLAPGVPVYSYGYPVSPYNYPSQYSYWPNYPSLVVVSPYERFYYYPTAVAVAPTPYFCAPHGQSFVSRVGLLDHLSGMHKIPLDAASAICPDGAPSCYVP